MFGDANGRRFDFHLLEHLGFAVGKDDNVAAIGAIVQRVGLEMADRLGWEWGSSVLLVPRLPAAFPLRAVLGGRLGRCDDVARRRFRRGRGVLLGRGKLLLESLDCCLSRSISSPSRWFSSCSVWFCLWSLAFSSTYRATSRSNCALLCWISASFLARSAARLRLRCWCVSRVFMVRDITGISQAWQGQFAGRTAALHRSGAAGRASVRVGRAPRRPVPGAARWTVLGNLGPALAIDLFRA